MNLCTAYCRESAISHMCKNFKLGVRRCEQSCDFFAFCQGGQAGNRFFEHGVFSTTETQHCQITVQALVTGFADLAEAER